jgi:hypothetical protein
MQAGVHSNALLKLLGADAWVLLRVLLPKLGPGAFSDGLRVGQRFNPHILRPEIANMPAPTSAPASIERFEIWVVVSNGIDRHQVPALGARHACIDKSRR